MHDKGHSIISLSDTMVLFQITKKNGECRLNQVVNAILS